MLIALSAVYTFIDNPKPTKMLFYFHIVNTPGDPLYFLFTFSPIKMDLCFLDNIFNHFVHILLIFQKIVEMHRLISQSFIHITVITILSLFDKLLCRIKFYFHILPFYCLMIIRVPERKNIYSPGNSIYVLCCVLA